MSEVKMKIKIGYNYLHLTDKFFFKNQLISNNMINGCDFQDLKAHSMDKKTFTKIKPSYLQHMFHQYRCLSPFENSEDPCCSQMR